MDYVYRPDVAAQIAEWVAYITPVTCQQQILDDANAAVNPDTQKALTALADSPLVFLPASATENLYTYAPLTPEQIPVYTDAFRRFIT
jgi:spermidine/putrescine transport system substrate-binding protein